MAVITPSYSDYKYAKNGNENRKDNSDLNKLDEAMLSNAIIPLLFG